MGEIHARDRCRRVHGPAFGQRDAGALAGFQQLEQEALFGVVGLCRIARRGTDAAILFLHQLFRRQVLVRSIAPELLANARMEILRESLREPVGERLEQDLRIVVVGVLEPLNDFFLGRAGGDGETADIIVLRRRNEVADRVVRLVAVLLGLLADAVEAPGDLLAGLVGVDLHIVTLPLRGEETDHALRLQPVLLDHLFQHGLRVVEQGLRRLAPIGIGEDFRIGPLHVPGEEEGRPVDIIDQVFQRDVVDRGQPHLLGLHRGVTLHVGVERLTARFLEL